MLFNEKQFQWMKYKVNDTNVEIQLTNVCYDFKWK